MVMGKQGKEDNKMCPTDDVLKNQKKSFPHCFRSNLTYADN